MPKKGNYIDLKNQRFGRLLVLEYNLPPIFII